MGGNDPSGNNPCKFLPLWGLHGILPEAHTWTIRLSYAGGGESGRKGIKAGFYLSAAFAVQRMLVSELAYFSLAPFLLSSTAQGVVYVWLKRLTLRQNDFIIKIILS